VLLFVPSCYSSEALDYKAASLPMSTHTFNEVALGNNISDNFGNKNASASAITPRACSLTALTIDHLLSSTVIKSIPGMW
jgi:hypothetical protein